ncbi:MAG: hypothetical protein C0424_05170 [Sphingobacteriaceae bacterium]|nr:hypothetical protein [Sphingobacteriaceae bacterium]
MVISQMKNQITHFPITYIYYGSQARNHSLHLLISIDSLIKELFIVFIAVIAFLKEPIHKRG